MNIVYQHQRLAMLKMRKERNVRNWSGNQLKVQMQDGVVMVEMLTKRTLNLEACVKLRKKSFPFFNIFLSIIILVVLLGLMQKVNISLQPQLVWRMAHGQPLNQHLLAVSYSPPACPHQGTLTSHAPALTST